MIDEKVKYSYKDISIVPAEISYIHSRSECDPTNIQDMLPIFTSPMATIVNEYNVDIWSSNKIYPIMPRNIGVSEFDNTENDIQKRIDHISKYLEEGIWVALSFKEFEHIFVKNVRNRENVINETDGKRQGIKLKHFNPEANKTYKVCIDLANGHMYGLYNIINEAKCWSRKYGYELIIMTGNIANPKTYEWICKNAEVDYIRLSIGSGFNCTSTTFTAIHYPIVSLIQECVEIRNRISKTSDYIKDTYNITEPYYTFPQADYRKMDPKNMKSRPYIIADGGIRNYADIIKAIGLGADYVMVGSLFTALLESAAPLNIEGSTGINYEFTPDGSVCVSNKDNNLFQIELINIWTQRSKSLYCLYEEEKRKFIKDMCSITKDSYGMSTEKAQMLLNPFLEQNNIKTSEGCYKKVQVTETVQQWSEHMIDYIKSAMSYTGKRTIREFSGKVDFIVNSNNTVQSINK